MMVKLRAGYFYISDCPYFSFKSAISASSYDGIIYPSFVYCPNTGQVVPKTFLA
jgi:hypothetical protein